MKKLIPAILICLICFYPFKVLSKLCAQTGSGELVSFTNMPDVLPNTQKLTLEGDISAILMDGAHKFIENKIRESVVNRSKYWNYDFSSRTAYEASVDPNRKRLMKCVGVEDKSKPEINYDIFAEPGYPPVMMQKFSFDDDPEVIAETNTYRIYQVRWPVLNRVYGEGLLLEPKTKPLGHIIALPDADQLPEQLAGLSPGIPAHSQFARQLAENGFQVLIPVIISRKFIFEDQTTQLTCRERIYRQGFEMGRHIIGYEIQKVIAAVDWIKKSAGNNAKVGVAGYFEGGLIAFYSAAIDTRIDAVLVSGYFNNRQKIWEEPLYRNIWGLLNEFGDAEIASLIAPRPMVVEYSSIPEINERIEKYILNPPLINGIPFSGYKGTLRTPPFKDVQAEFRSIDQLVKQGFQQKFLIYGKGNEPVEFGSQSAMEKFTASLGFKPPLLISADLPVDRRTTFDPDDRQTRQIKEMEDHVQWLLRDSDYQRERYYLYKVMPEFEKRPWSTMPYHQYYSPDRFIEQSELYRKEFHEQFIGKYDDKMLPPNPRTRKMYDRERWTGYEVVLDVFPDLIAWGFLLIPKDLKPGEKRPVVVVQHGRARVPQIMIEGNSTAYNDVAAKLADKGFIVFAPHNLYRGEDLYRWLSRKANALGKNLFSFILVQHDQILQWLGSLPYVDESRIGFYGLSFGGATAMRIPSILKSYSLSICSGDYSDWTRRIVDSHAPISYLRSAEWEIPCFNMGNHFNYAEMAYLIFPRPFMVERGHDDLVSLDSWVGHEYAKVKYLYDQFNCEDKTTIEFFNGGHSMRCEGTIDFLKKHLRWP